MPKDPKQPTGDAELTKAINGLLTQLKSGDSGVDGSIARLIERVQDRNQELTAEIETLRGQLPGEADVVLTGDAVAAHKAYEALGKPDEIKTKLDAGDAASAEIAERKKAEAFADAADVHGYAPTVLERLMKQDGLEVVKVETTKDDDGNETKTAIVRAGEKDAPVALDQYATENWKEFLPALAADSGDSSGSGTNEPGPGVYPIQRPTGRTSGRDATPDEIAERKLASGAYSGF